MKRVLLHILFWSVYLVQDILLHFTWMASVLPGVPDETQLAMAAKTACVLLLPKLLLAYYLIRYAVKKILDDRRTQFWTIAEIIAVMFLSVILFRIIFHYIVYPKIYLLPVKIQLSNVRNFLISVIEIGYITGVAFTLKLLRLQMRMKAREQNLLREKLDTELKFLRSQTNPHFLFNTLNNIYALARKKSDKTPEVVMKLSELLSFMLYESGKDRISIEQEIKILEDYICLERIRYNERLSITFEKEIDDPTRTIAPLVLLPLVENAFKHGVSETRFDSFVKVRIVVKDGFLHFTVQNTVEEIKEKMVSGNIGLNNIRRQLQLLYKDHELTVNPDGHTFIVNMKINLESYGKV